MGQEVFDVSHSCKMVSGEDKNPSAESYGAVYRLQKLLKSGGEVFVWDIKI